MKKYLLVISISVNIILIAAVFIVGDRFGGLIYLFLKLQSVPHGVEFEDRISHFKTLPETKNEIVFLGNSLTARGNWNELFDSRCINRGVGGDDTYRLLQRLDEIIKRKPAKIFIEIGINDLSRKRYSLNMLDNYQKIIDQLKQGTPNTDIYVQSILPVNNKIKYHFRDNAEIISMNEKLRQLSLESKVNYVDLYTFFVATDGELNPLLTTDGIHINGNGYQVWKKAIEQYVNEGKDSINPIP